MIIYKKYNQQELNLQYNNRFHVPDFENYLQRWEKLSSTVRKQNKIYQDIPYGDRSREGLDIFSSPNPLSKALVFIHGGYWQRFDKSLFHFIAGAFVSYGITTVLINYPLTPDVSIDQIVKSCSVAICWLHNNIESFIGDAGEYTSQDTAQVHILLLC